MTGMWPVICDRQMKIPYSNFIKKKGKKHSVTCDKHAEKLL